MVFTFSRYAFFVFWVTLLVIGCIHGYQSTEDFQRPALLKPAPEPTVDESLYPDRVYIGQGYMRLKLTGGWERDMGWPLAPVSILASGDSLVLETKKDHPFVVDGFGQDPFPEQPVPHRPPMIYKANAYRYVPIDSSLVSLPRWQWRRILARLNRLENINRR